QEQRIVIAEPSARVAAHFGERLLKMGLRLGGDFEAKDVLSSVFRGRIARSVAEVMAGHELLHRAHPFPSRELDPLALGLGDSDSSQLPDHRPTELAALQSAREERQPLE